MSTLSIAGRLRPAAPTTSRSSDRWWRLGGAGIAVLLVAIAWLFVISPQRAQTNELNSQSDTARTQNAALQQRIESLRAADQKLATYQSAYAAARQALPSTNDIPALLRSLQSLGDASHTQVTSLQASAPVAIANSAAAATTAGTTSGGTAAGTTSGATTSGATGASSAGTAATASAASGVYSMALTMTVAGTTSSLESFLNQLQTKQPRALLITQITEGVAGGATAPTSVAAHGSTTSLQLTMQAFVAPSASATAGGVTTATTAAPK